MSPNRLLERFLRYVQVDTTADDQSATYPSSPGQWTLGKMLVAELTAMGATEVEQDEHALIWGTIPASPGCQGPTIAFNAHLDTSPETTGKNVQPQVIHDYPGGDIVLPRDPSKVIRVAENPELTQLIGKTLITTDGTTLLGSDDKSGVAVIMELAEHLCEHPEIVHGPVKILFTCDEEIGQGVKHVDLKKLGAVAAYTLDGAGTNEIDVETFSADQANITIRGVNIHPSIAKGRMVNAVRVAATFLEKMPQAGFSPETTAGRDGFWHPYTIEGGVAEVKIKILLRDFVSQELENKATRLRAIAAETEQHWPGSRVEVAIVRQYRNMADGLAKEPRVVRLAEEAHRRLGRDCRLTIVRGGTDGSQFTEKGLPTPNLSTGEHNPHSPLEWTCLEEMVQAVEVLTELSKLWGEQR